MEKNNDIENLTWFGNLPTPRLESTKRIPLFQRDFTNSLSVSLTTQNPITPNFTLTQDSLKNTLRFFLHYKKTITREERRELNEFWCVLEWHNT